MYETDITVEDRLCRLEQDVKYLQLYRDDVIRRLQLAKKLLKVCTTTLVVVNVLTVIPWSKTFETVCDIVYGYEWIETPIHVNQGNGRGYTQFGTGYKRYHQHWWLPYKSNVPYIKFLKYVKV